MLLTKTSLWFFFSYYTLQTRPMYCNINLLPIPTPKPAQILVTICQKVIHLSKTTEGLVAVTQGFVGLAIHQDSCVIDGSQVRINPTGGPSGHCFINRRLCASVHIQAICDHQGPLVLTRGLAHDARVI